MDKEKILNLANKGLELVEDMDRKSIYKNLLGNLFFEMRKEAINYTHCCETFYCQSHIEDNGRCNTQCEHCKEYYKPLEQ